MVLNSQGQSYVDALNLNVCRQLFVLASLLDVYFKKLLVRWSL